VAFQRIRELWPRFEVDHGWTAPVTMSNVAAYSHVRCRSADDTNSIPQLLELRRAETGRAEVLVTDDERLTFAEADQGSWELAGALLAAGVAREPRIGILSRLRSVAH